MDSTSYSGHSFVDITSKNRHLYFTIGARIVNNHKRCIQIYKIHPVLLGRVKVPFFKGHNPYTDLEGEYT